MVVRGDDIGASPYGAASARSSRCGPSCFAQIAVISTFEYMFRKIFRGFGRCIRSPFV